MSVILKNHLEYVRGVTYKAGDDLHRELNESSVTLLRANNIKDGELCFDDVQYVDRSRVKQKQLLRKGDILVCASSGSKNLVGKASLVTKDMDVTFGAFCCVLRPKGIDPEFLSHYFQSKQYRGAIEESCTGSSINNLKADNFYSLRLPNYDRQTQFEVATNLNEVSIQLAVHRRMLSKLDDLVKSRFVEMFGDPIENPFGWDIAPLGELGDLKNGVNFKSVDSGTEIRCLGVGDFKGRYQIRDTGLISLVSLNGKPNDSQLLRDGDIVFVRSNGNKQLVGRCLAVFPGDEEVTFSGFCIRFRSEGDKLQLDYLLGCLKSDPMRKAMIGRGANIQNLSQKILSEVAMPIPPLALQQEFAAFVQQVDKLRFDVQQSIDKLQMLYDSLAQEYFGVKEA